MKVKKLNCRINVLIEEDIKIKAEQNLADEGLTISDYVRYCLRLKSMEAKKDNKK